LQAESAVIASPNGPLCFFDKVICPQHAGCLYTLSELKIAIVGALSENRDSDVS